MTSKREQFYKRRIAELERYEALSGPACMPKGKTRQEPHKDWVMPDLEVDDPDAQ